MKNSIDWVAKEHQKIAGKAYLKMRYIGLFMDPGLGKTSTTLAAWSYLYKRGTVGPLLVIAPKRVCQQVWPLEVDKWSMTRGKKVVELTGPLKNRKDKLLSGADVFVINHELVKWLHDTLLGELKRGAKNPFGCLVVDESSKMFKNPTSKRLGYLINMRPLFSRIAILTGTPTPSSYLDLWSQIKILDGGDALGTNFYQYRRKYFERTNPYNPYQWSPKPGAIDEIARKISHLVLNFADTKWLKTLPKLVFNTISVKLDKAEMGKYREMEKDLIVKFEDNSVSAASRMLAFNYCHQIANGCVYEQPSELVKSDYAKLKEFMQQRNYYKVHNKKIEALEQLVYELQGRPLLVAYKFKHDLIELMKAFPDAESIGSHTKDEELLGICRRWNEGKIKILFGQPASMGHGLNLQSGGLDVCFFSMNPNYDEVEQFYRRVYRNGVEGEKVTVHLIITKGTVDEKVILPRCRDKAAAQRSIRELIAHYRRSDDSQGKI